MIVDVINYDGKVFRSVPVPGTVGSDEERPVGRYHQKGNLVWAEFDGGPVVRGSLVGTCGEDGTLDLAYCQVLVDGRVVSGHCRSRPELHSGRLRLREEWRRYGAADATGVSYIEEVDP